ncbi:MAG: LysR family transcriptional regulator [Rhodospirillaceae bacterium]|jgi:DNA-binding transcriptional LysR family regulator|nr:LysR family transcriptional regulator [Rhodospirillaceae bacterium]MBT5300529.1 LysR family transcriptional regulator [Rhodospirillaceae bacterium]MBT5514975.1 LysR family transcriptional regulator [Rhodospirillaceae bacterium]MBT6087684.1 LysR family transcriptional regulator [Rhodospirillaceae bacterium]MBT6609323.1 LysR family transcriptional regulator [Rhodospirillaceae bacterium]
MDWDKLRIFHAVAEAGSFTHAGETLNLSQSAVSRQIANLEDSLHIALFHRHARGLKLTEQGEDLFSTAHDVFAQLAMAEARITENRERPEGPLMINTTVAFGSVWLTSRINTFVDRYPDIEVSLVLADNELDLSMREADAAIRMTAPTQPDLIQRHLMTMNYNVFASPGYLKKWGMPKKAEDLDAHRLIVYGEDARPPVENLNWLLTEGTPKGVVRKPALQVSNIYGIFRAVQSGVGIAALPDYMNREVGNLIEVLPELRGPSVEVYFVYPEELRESKRIVVLRDFLLKEIKASSF